MFPIDLIPLFSIFWNEYVSACIYIYISIRDRYYTIAGGWWKKRERQHRWREGASKQQGIRGKWNIRGEMDQLGCHLDDRRIRKGRRIDWERNVVEWSLLRSSHVWRNMETTIYQNMPTRTTCFSHCATRLVGTSIRTALFHARRYLTYIDPR